MAVLNILRLILLAISPIAAVMIVTGSAAAASPPVTRAASYEVKAVFIYNFTKFVTWPSTSFVNAADPIKVCIMDNSALGEALEALAGKTSKGRHIKTFSYQNITEGDKCHLIFISESVDTPLTKKILLAVGKSPVLTVGDSAAFVHQGGIIKFIASGNKLAFEINPATARRSGLEISSKMLSLAKIVGELP